MRISEIGEKLNRLISGTVSYDRNTIDCYSVDSSSYAIKPKIIVFPKNKKDIARIVKFAAKNKIGITPRGGGTGLVGSAVGDGIIIDLKSLNKITLGKNYVIAQAGAPKGALDKILQKNRKFLGPNPSVGPYCTIGGMVATNASGSRSLKYGSTIDNILEIEFIDGYGNIVNFPDNSQTSRKILKLAHSINMNDFPRTSKNSCGYRLDAVSTINNVQKILAGSEGTLGIIVSAKLRIFIQPKERILMIFAYKSAYQSMQDCKKIILVKPAALEFIDENIIKNIDYSIPNKTKYLLFVEMDSNIEKSRILKKICTGILIKTVKSASGIKKWWRYRDLALSYSLNILKMEHHIIEDAAVPIENLDKLVLLVERIKKEFNVKIIMYGHAGNGNIHVRLNTGHDKKIIEKIAKKYFTKVNKLSGTITAEHGDGLARTRFIKQQYGNDIMLKFKRLKKLLDPDNILNPGKIISKKT